MRGQDGLALSQTGNVIEATLERRDLEGSLINLYLHAGDRQLHVNLHYTGIQDLGAEATTRLTFDHHDTVVMRPGPLARERA